MSYPHFLLEKPRTLPRGDFMTGCVRVENVPPLPGAWIESARGFILDLDGTLIRERRTLAGARELLARLADRYIVLSNNSTDTAKRITSKLHRMGLKVAPDRLLLAGESSVRTLAAERPGLTVMLIGSRTLCRFAAQAGLSLTDRKPEVVLLARDEGFNYRKLRAAANALRDGAQLIATNPDGYHPGDDGRGIVPETGALLQALVACSGTQPSRIIGKPESPLFIEALRRLGTSVSDTVVIGDNRNTDALGAARLGMRFLLTGDSRYADARDPASLLQHRGMPHARLDEIGLDDIGLPVNTRTMPHALASAPGAPGSAIRSA
jgi:4-nitrophenyl phosphatase